MTREPTGWVSSKDCFKSLNSCSLGEIEFSCNKIQVTYSHNKQATSHKKGFLWGTDTLAREETVSKSFCHLCLWGPFIKGENLLSINIVFPFSHSYVNRLISCSVAGQPDRQKHFKENGYTR